jgi:hypothetical protein
MKLSLGYKDGRWICSAPELAKALRDHETPDLSLEKALKAFHSRYYPDESASATHNPWILHREYGPEEVAKRATEHELTWHWRLLLPLVRDSRKAKDPGSIVLCVSQVRQWQLVTCFRMEWPTLGPRELACAVRVAPKCLLRPPVFGRSHRVTRYEVYSVFHEPLVLEEIRNAVVLANNDEFRLAHVLGRHDTYFRIVQAELAPNKTDYILHIEHVVDVEPEQAPITLEGETAVTACRPYGLAYLPSFQQTPKTEPAASQEVLLSSDNYCRAFEQLSEVVNDPSARAVLLIAPPGSGKEGLSAALHNCRQPKGGDLIVVSLAGLDESQAAQLLFHLDYRDLEARLDSAGHTPAAAFRVKLSDGAFFKAVRGTLVIDELDKVQDSVRSMLLRVLENDDVTVPGTAVTIRIPSEVRPLIVFVASKPRGEVLQLRPIDFWSRITHLVEMQHPLALGENTDRMRVAEDYIRIFWIKHVNSFFGEQHYLSRAQGEFYEPVRQLYARWWRFFVDSSVGEFVANEMASLLCASGQPLPSIRSLRVAVARSFGVLFHALLYHKRGGAPLEVWRRAAGGDPADRLRLLISRVREDIIEEADGKFSHPELGAITEMRNLVRVATTTQV